MAEAKKEPRTGVVTPTLMLGPIEMWSHLSRTKACATAEAAVKHINRGGTAILPPGSWDMAGDTLRLLGANELIVEDRLHFARTGEILHAV